MNCRGAIRLSPETIERMPDDEIRRIYLHNEQEEAKGCAVPN